MDFQELLKNSKVQNKTLIMGILNVTPDSFSDGGKFNRIDSAISHVRQMLKDGADIIDIGGESTKPGSDPVSVEEEIKRVIPIITKIKKEFSEAIISIDTMKAQVAKEAIIAGANIINDVTGLRDQKMVNVAVKYQVPVIIMHMLGMPKTMQQDVNYQNCTGEIKDYLKIQASKAINAGIKRENIVLDPGIGFGKTVEQNFELIKNISLFKDLGFQILMGTSRKSFLGKTLKEQLSLDEIPLSSERLEATIASVVLSAINGADIVRVHDVKECKKALAIVDYYQSKE